MSSAVSVTTTQFLPSGLRALILAAAYWVLSLPLTTTAGSIAAAVGCIIACFAVDALGRKSPLRELRQTVFIAATVMVAALAALLGQLLTASPLLADLLGPMTSFELAQILWWLSLAGGLTAIMRNMAQRGQAGKLLEILFVASAFVLALEAHRQGMIHRPYFIGDFALIRGIDPSSILLAIGAAAVLCLSALLMMESNHRRLPYHFTVLGLLCFSLLGYVQFFGMPTPSLTDDLGLTGQAAGNRSGQSQENPFSDGENDPEDREAPVAIVLFRDDYTPEEGIYYFRESAYSEFDGRMLVTATDPALDRDLVRRFSSGRTTVDATIPAADRRQRVRTTIGLLTPHRHPFGLAAPLEFSDAPNPNSLRFKQTYDVVSLVPRFSFPDLLGREAGAADWSLSQWQEYLAMPDDPRYEQLAGEIVGTVRREFAEDPYARAMAVKQYLDENGIYSLRNEHAGADDPAASFLFGDLTGYCVHFAYAATYLYRSLGIPARVGVGYAVPADNRAGGSSLLIQAVHGHAWPEIYLRDRGWVIVDPSPSRTLVDMSMDPQGDLQQLLGDMLRNDASFSEFVESRSERRLTLGDLLRMLTATAIVALVGGWLVRLYRQMVPLFCPGASLYRMAYRAALDRLAAHGESRGRGESREAFARRLAADLPAFSRLTDAHLAGALRGTATTGWPSHGQAALPVSDAALWRELLKQLDQELRGRYAWWRRLLAALDPSPWLRSR